jgi:hypothetical protein
MNEDVEHNKNEVYLPWVFGGRIYLFGSKASFLFSYNKFELITYFLRIITKI